ncbi:MAG: ATP-binding protein, partial [Syntrophomonas sp.]
MNQKIQRILIIEDDLIDQMALERAIKRDNLSYGYYLAGSITEARKALEKEDFDVVISDLALGDGTLFDIQDFIVKKGIPIIVTTGTGDGGIAVKAIKNGADDYIIKDVEGNYLKILPTTIEKAIESKRNDELITKLSRALEQSPGFIIITDVNRQIEYVNPKFIEVTGYSGQDVSGQDLSTFLAGEDSCHLFEEAWLNVKEGREWKGELCSKKKNGECYWEIVSISVIRNKEGYVSNYLKVGEDITNRKKAEGVLEQARQTAEAANQAKSEFLANMSHEIRTPLNGIIGMTELLLETPLDDFQTEYANIIMDSARDLLLVISDILDFSKIEAKLTTVENSDFELVPLIKSLTRILSPQAAKKRLLFRTLIDHEIPITLNGDPLRLRQILLNLINNAIKFTEKGTVTIQASLENRNEYQVMVKFEISDTGIGIATSDQGKLFQPFVQVDCSSTRRFGGTGLGLAICKRLVEVMNGAIGLESTLGEGSKFWFVLPFGCNNNLNTRDAEDKGDADLEKEYNLDQTLPAEDSAPDISQDHLLVLLVEDDPVARKLAQYQLNKLGYQAHVAVNGREAVYAATNN